MSDKNPKKSQTMLDGQIKNSTFGRTKENPISVRPEPPKAQIKTEEKK